MNLITNLMWMLGAAMSLGFLAYGAFLVLFVPKLQQIRVGPAPRVELARSPCAN